MAIPGLTQTARTLFIPLTNLNLNLVSKFRKITLLSSHPVTGTDCHYARMIIQALQMKAAPLEPNALQSQISLNCNYFVVNHYFRYFSSYYLTIKKLILLDVCCPSS